jgi:hypothetical protein
MHYEVDMVVQTPFDDRARRFRGDAISITITVEAHAMDRDGAVKAARREIAHIYPGGDYRELGEPRPT